MNQKKRYEVKVQLTLRVSAFEEAEALKVLRMALNKANQELPDTSSSVIDFNPKKAKVKELAF